MPASSPVTTLGPLQQLRAGRLGRRLPQLYVGLILYGISLAMMLRSNIGLPPWDVLAQGLARWIPVSFGTITILVGALVLLLWLPLRQRPGLGTLSNVIMVGLAVDFGLWLIPEQSGWPLRITLLISGILLNGVAGATYTGSQFGPGPRDGLMTGLSHRTGRSLRLVRSGIEITVLIIGFLLGGTVGVGTVAYALAIGPLVQFFLRWTAVRLEPA